MHPKIKTQLDELAAIKQNIDHLKESRDRLPRWQWVLDRVDKEIKALEAQYNELYWRGW
jgi:DNA repair exonuclease SbcCD ATPase subunit